MTSYQGSHYSLPAMNELQRANAFVVQFRTEPGSAAGKLAGRVEHVASGRTAWFEAIEDLPELLRQMLKGTRLKGKVPTGAERHR